MSKRIITLIVVFIMVMSMGSSVFATEPTDTNTTGENQSTLPEVFTTTNTETGELNTGIPEVSIDDVTEWADRKGHEIIILLQRFAQPFTIIMFIACAIITLIGAFGDSRMVSRGISGMAITLVVYAVVINAQKIMDLFLAFISN